MATNENNGKIKGAMFYPVAVIFIALGLLAYLMVVIVPKFQEIFTELSMNKPLPWFTQVVLGFSATFKNHILIVLGVGFAAILSLQKYCRTKKDILIIERAMIIFLALVVGTIVIALFQPLISIITELGNTSHPPPTRADPLK